MSKTESKPVDLSAFDGAMKLQEEGLLVPIVGMDGKTPLGFSVRIAGPDSERAIAAQEAMGNELIEREDISTLSAKDRRASMVRYLARVTMAFEPYVAIGGQQLSYSEENAVKLYSQYPFIREQVDRSAGKRAAFLKG
jgi:hypothetical protein